MSKWTVFFDMHSGGGRKWDHELTLVEGDYDSACALFEKHTGQDPHYETCHCCGADYSVTEFESFEKAREIYDEPDVFIIRKRSTQATARKGQEGRMTDDAKSEPVTSEELAEPVTSEELSEWERLAAEATPGEWYQRAEQYVFGPSGITVAMTCKVGGKAEDAAFIAAARDAVPRLCASLRAKETKLDTVFDEGVVVAEELADVEAERDALRSEVERLQTRQQELLATVARIANETPYPDEIKGWEGQRAKMIAEIGTLRAEVERLRSEAAHLTGWKEGAIEGAERLKAEVERLREYSKDRNETCMSLADALNRQSPVIAAARAFAFGYAELWRAWEGPGNKLCEAVDALDASEGDE